MSFHVIYLPQARHDIRSAVDWISNSSSSAAARWRIGLFRIVEKLESDPHRYAFADEADELNLPLRQLLYGKRPQVHRILFTVDGILSSSTAFAMRLKID